MGGIFGVITKGNCSETLFYGVDYHSHLGTEYAGLAVLGQTIQKKIHTIDDAQFKSKFFKDYKNLVGKMGIGVISYDVQPIITKSELGLFVICTNGYITNKKELEDKLMKKNVSFSEVHDDEVVNSELVAKLIIQRDNLIDGIDYMFDQIDGSISLLLLNKEGIYAAGDRFPLFVGERNGEYAVTSETFALPKLGFKLYRELQPKEIILID